MEATNAQRLHSIVLQLMVIYLSCIPTVFAADDTNTVQELPASQTLTIVSWGGAYEASQNEAYFKPYTLKTGIQISTLSYNGGIDK